MRYRFVHIDNKYVLCLYGVVSFVHQWLRLVRDSFSKNSSSHWLIPDLVLKVDQSLVESAISGAVAEYKAKVGKDCAVKVDTDNWLSNERSVLLFEFFSLLLYVLVYLIVSTIKYEIVSKEVLKNTTRFL